MENITPLTRVAARLLTRASVRLLARAASRQQFTTDNYQVIGVCRLPSNCIMFIKSVGEAR